MTWPQLNPDLDLAPYRSAFARDGRVHVPDILTQSSAEATLAALKTHSPWNIVARVQGQHRDFDLPAYLAAPADKAQRLVALAHAEARAGFGYLYENYPIHDVWRREGPAGRPLDAIAEFLNSPAFLDFARTVTGAANIAFADGQATCYRAGHFLTQHNDLALGEHRLVAYVLNLTPRWRADWGGQLLFHDARGNVTGGYMPAFNAINLFAVPAEHSVSVVAPYVSEGRYTVTGWLRAGAPPPAGP